MGNEPHAKRRGWLKNDNPPGDFLKALRCGGEDAQADSLPRSRDAKRALPDAWRDKYGAENGGWPEAESPRPMEARGVLARSARDESAGAA